MSLHSRHLWEILCGGTPFGLHSDVAAALFLSLFCGVMASDDNWAGDNGLFGMALISFNILGFATDAWAHIFSPFIDLSGSRQLGRKLAKMRLLLTPEEQESPVIIRATNSLQSCLNFNKTKAPTESVAFLTGKPESVPVDGRLSPHRR